MTRAEHAAIAAGLKAQGLNGIQIAKRMGWSTSHAYALLSDPDGSHQRERRKKYRGVCRACGGATSHPSGTGPHEYCRACFQVHLEEMGRAYVLDAIHEWAEMFGEPPTAMDWNQSLCRHLDTPKAHLVIERYEASGREWPSAHTAQDRFGSFSNALRAAGFEPVPMKYRWMGRAAYEAMLEDQDVAA